MQYRKEYEPTAAQIRKLNELQSQLTHCFHAARVAWKNRDYDNAIELFNQGNAAVSALNAHFGQLCKWRNDGVGADYAE